MLSLEKRRRRMLAAAGLAANLPSLETMRKWAWIDDRTPPSGEADGEFKSHSDWVNNAARTIGWTGAKCFDARNRPCRNGGDFKRALEENTFPVRYYWPERFPASRPLTERSLRIRNAIAACGDHGVTIAELRARPGLKRVTAAKIDREISGKGECSPDGRWRMTPQGVEETRFEMSMAHRASWVRRT